MYLKLKTISFFFILVSLLCNLNIDLISGQQAGRVPVIRLISPSVEDSLNTSGRILISAEIFSYSTLQTFRIIHNGKVFASESAIQLKQKDNNTYLLESFVPVVKGKNTVSVEARNSAGYASSEKRYVNCQFIPFVTWLTPLTASSTVHSARTNISVEIQSGTPLLNVRMNLNGVLSEVDKAQLKPLNNEIYVFETTIRLKGGRNNVYFTINNARGETRSVTRNITLSASPFVTLINPVPGDSINTSGTVIVSAEILSQQPLQSYRINQNDVVFANENSIKPRQTDSNKYVIESLVPLRKGLNTVYAEAKNSAGSAISEKRIINYQVEPFITWITPLSASSSVESENQKIRAEIRTGLPLQKLSLNLNGTETGDETAFVSKLNDNTFVFEKGIKLNPGPNTISLSAGNTRGESRSSARSVTFGSTPIVSLLSPAPADSINTSGRVLVRAQIISSIAIQSFRIVHNGQTVINETGTKPNRKDSITYIVESFITVNAGLNTISVEAKNALGTESSEKRTVTTQSKPFISWLLPEAESTVTESPALVVSARIKSSFEIQNLSINLNGTIIPTDPADLFKESDDTYLFKKSIPNILSAKNTVSLSAANLRGASNSLPRSISYSAGSKPVIRITSMDSLNTTGIVLFTAEIISRTRLQAVRLMQNNEIVVTETTKNPEQKDSITYIVKGLLPLKAGTNTFSVDAKNTIGTTFSDKVSIVCQPAPLIKWITPSAVGSTAGSETMVIKAEIISGLDLIGAGINVNGTLISNLKEGITRIDNVRYNLEITVRLKQGENSLFLVASNARGENISNKRIITYEPGNISEITWITPAEANSVTRTGDLILSAKIKSRSEVRSIRLTVNGNEQVSGDISKTVRKDAQGYQYENKIVLEPGTNTLEFTAITGEGSITAEKRTINYTPPVEPVLALQNSESAKVDFKPQPPPEIIWIAPSGATSDISQPAAEIRAKVKSTEKLQSLLVYVNGIGSEEINQVVPTDIPGEFLFRKTINLQPADNNIYLSATNSAGSVRSEERLIRNPPASKPLITWAVPAANTSVNTDMIVVEACIQSGSPLKEAQIWVNSSQWASETVFQATNQGECTYKFAKPVLLKEGDNNVFITAINAAGSEMSERRIIRYQKGLSERRLALVIGNSQYKNSLALKNPVNDANLMEGTLKTLDFEIIKCLNATKTEMEKAIRQFSDKLRDYNVALFYYAGHGIQVGGENYLVPIDAVLDKEADCQWEAVQVNTIVRQFEQVPENVNILVLDACRDNPFKSWTRGAPQGFKMLNTVSGTFVAFATSEGTTAADGDGENGVFTEELVKEMVKPQSIFNVFVNTRKQVMLRTKNNQRPQDSNMLTGDFYFKR